MTKPPPLSDRRLAQEPYPGHAADVDRGRRLVQLLRTRGVHMTATEMAAAQGVRLGVIYRALATLRGSGELARRKRTTQEQGTPWEYIARTPA